MVSPKKTMKEDPRPIMAYIQKLVFSVFGFGTVKTSIPVKNPELNPAKLENNPSLTGIVFGNVGSSERDRSTGDSVVQHQQHRLLLVLFDCHDVEAGGFG